MDPASESGGENALFVVGNVTLWLTSSLTSKHLVSKMKDFMFHCKNQAGCLGFFPSSSIAGLEGVEVVHQELGVFIKLYGGPKLKQERFQVGIRRNFSTLRSVEQVKQRSCDQIKP